MWGALSDKRTGLSCARVIVSSSKNVVSTLVCTIYFIHVIKYLYVCMYVQYIQGLGQSRLSIADHALLVRSCSCYNGSLVTWTVISLNLLYFLCQGSPCPMLRTFALSWFCMTSACCLHKFCNIIIYVQKFESHVQIANRCAPWKISNGAENSVLQSLQFQ
jgi:hypothetical protein